MKIGSHVSNNGDLMLLGSVEEALSYGANCFMIYLGAPQNTYRKDISKMNHQAMEEVLEKSNIQKHDVIIHAPYIVNLAQSDEDKWHYAISFLTSEVKLTASLGFKYIVLHPGAHMGKGVEYGIKRISEGIKKILNNTEESEVTILLETMAGKGTEIGKTFEELKAILDEVSSPRIGICLDTCHIFDGGYNIVDLYEETLQSFDQTIGFDYLKVIHLNDSKNSLGSHKDRHENIGFGEIGFDTLAKFATDERFKQIPKILETPYIKDCEGNKISPYLREIEMLKKNQFDENLKTSILTFYNNRKSA